MKIAVFASTIDPIFLTKSQRDDCVVIAADKSALAKFVHTVFDEDQIITLPAKLFHSDKTLFLESDLGSLCREKKVTHFLKPHRSSKILEEWCVNNKIIVIGTSNSLQDKLENKFTFDGLLTKHNVPKPVTVIDLNQIADDDWLVVQKRSSYGMFGTNIYKSKNDVPLFKNMLVRKYIHGIPMGLSILRDSSGQMLVSAARIQCYTYENSVPTVFLGIQWIPTESLNESERVSINGVIHDVSILLTEEKFTGIANIDFILSETKAYVLECNPRLSSSTTHLFSHPDLTHGINSWEFYVNTFTGKQNVSSQLQLPESEFAGSLLDIDVIEKHKIRHIPEIGLKRSADREYFLVHDMKEGQQILEDDTAATLISDGVFFDTEGKITETSSKLVAQIYKSIFVAQ